MRRAVAIATLLALSIPAPAFARGKFDPTTEFEQHNWIPIHLGPLNLSITKAVAYLMIGTVLTILLGLGLMRSRLALLPDRRQTIGEAIYEVTQVQIAEQGSDGIRFRNRESLRHVGGRIEIRIAGLRGRDRA